MEHTFPPTYIHRRHARSRSVKISFDNNGRIVVTTPPRFPASRIPEYVQKSRDWIEKHATLFRRRVDTLQLGGEKHVYVLGKPYRIQRDMNIRSDQTVTVIGEELIVC